jgi:hypothetical protein
MLALITNDEQQAEEGMFTVRSSSLKIVIVVIVVIVVMDPR